MITAEIIVPLLNANEPEARVVKIHVKDRARVEKGAVLFTLETTKAAVDVEAPAAGYIRLLAAEGDNLPVGDKLAVLTGTAGEAVEIASKDKGREGPAAGLRITRPARRLAESLQVDPSALPADRLITEEIVRQYAGQAAAADFELPAADKPYILIYGGGGHAKSVMEIVRQLGTFSIAGIVDDGIQAGAKVLEIPILGSRSVLPRLLEKGVRAAANGVGGIVDIQVRVRIFELLGKSGFGFPVLVHPRATVEPSAKVSEGVQVFANAYIGAEAVLQPRGMVNTNAVVSHDCEIGEYTHIAPGALLAGHVHVGKRSLVGMGVTTSIGVRIGDGVRIGNGAIILADVPDGTIIQAGRFWTGK